MFIKGQPPPPGAGRKKGSKNRPKTTVWQILEAQGFDLVAKIIVEYEQLDEPAERLNALFKLMEYCYQRYKPADTIEHGIDDTDEIKVSEKESENEKRLAEILARRNAA